MKKMIRIANTQAFWGDQIEASAQLLQQEPNIDYLTLDYLSEVSLSIMATQRAKDPRAGYAKDFLDVVKSLVPFWKGGSPVKIVTNAGGLSPKLCAEACADILKQAGIDLMRIAVIYGDDVLEIIKNDSLNPHFNNLETNQPISQVLNRLTTANAYLGAKSIAEALTLGADIVITGRIADPSMTVGPCVAHFGWHWTDYDKIAQATVAGHLIECGTQATGGISTKWLDVADLDSIGYPIVEVDKEANIIVTKSEKSGGLVTLDILKEQLLYEMGDPNAYLSPDVTVSILSLRLEQVGKDRILVSGSNGRPPPTSYKVSATYNDGYRAEAILAIFGRDCAKKARRCGEIILNKMQRAGYHPERYQIECLGCGDIVPGVVPFEENFEFKKEKLECLLRICIADLRIEVLQYFSKQIAPLVTCGPQGTTGYTTGRPHIRPVFAYWPCLIDAREILPKTQSIEVLQ